MQRPRPIPRLLLVLGYLSLASPALAALPNAWQIRDESAEARSTLSFGNNLTSTQHVAATNPAGGGFIYSVRARLVADRGEQTMVMAYGLGDRRFQLGFDLNEHGDLVTALQGGSSYTLTRGGTGTNLYHTHSIEFNPTNGTATYLLDGVPIVNNWTGSVAAMVAGQVYWGAGRSPGQGIMNFHQITFEVKGFGVVASYDSVTAGNPDPVKQGWTRQPDVLSRRMDAGPVTDPALPPVIRWWQRWFLPRSFINRM